MDFSNQAKGKIYILLVFAFVLLSSFPVFELFFDIPRPILLVWAFLCCTIILFGGFVYGILTKSRIGAVVLGFSFPFIFGILKYIIVWYQIDQFYALQPHLMASYWNPYPFPLLIIAVSNVIACWFVTAAKETENKRIKADAICFLFMTISFICVAGVFMHIIS